MGATTHSPTYDVVVLGAGYAGLMTALRLRRRKGLRLALISTHDAFVERVRLQESIAVSVAPRLASMAEFVAGTNIEFIRGTVRSIDPTQRRICVAGDFGTQDITFGQAVYALGSTIDTEAVPGVADNAYRLEAGDGPRSASALRARLQASAGQPLRVVVVGGAETGVEVAGEIKAAWPSADVSLVSRSRCGAFKGARVETAVRSALRELGVRLFDGETVREVSAAAVVLGSNHSIDHDICVWSGGLRAPGLARDAGLSTDPHGRIWVDADLRSISHPQIFAVGDAAHPVAPSGAPYRLSAFTALVSGAHAADVILAQRVRQQLPPFSFSTFGQGIAIGRGGVGFLSYPDDRQRSFIVQGRTARTIRNFFVWLVLFVLRLERARPGFFFWPGRGRVSWQQANAAVRELQRVPV